ncbi:MAG: hypothetical protein ABJG96_14700 [Paracoccaceae bacterium]
MQQSLLIALTDVGEILEFAINDLSVPRRKYWGTSELEDQLDGISRDTISFSPDGVVFAVGGNIGQIAVFRVGQSAPIVELETGVIQVQQAAFSPDGRFLAALDTSRKITIWSVDGGTVTSRAINISYLFALSVDETEQNFAQIPASIQSQSISLKVAGQERPERFTLQGSDIVITTTFGRLMSISPDLETMKARAGQIVRVTPVETSE